MIVAVSNNKCDIAALVHPYSLKLQWGMSLTVDTGAIMENYINYLNCPTVHHINCYKSSCKPVIERVACNLQVNMTAVTVGDTITFTVTAITRSRRR